MPPRTPSIPIPGDDPASLRASVLAMREVLLGMGMTGSVGEGVLAGVAPPEVGRDPKAAMELTTKQWVEAEAARQVGALGTIPVAKRTLLIGPTVIANGTQFVYVDVSAYSEGDYDFYSVEFEKVTSISGTAHLYCQVYTGVAQTLRAVANYQYGGVRRGVTWGGTAYWGGGHWAHHIALYLEYYGLMSWGTSGLWGENKVVARFPDLMSDALTNPKLVTARAEGFTSTPQVVYQKFLSGYYGTGGSDIQSKLRFYLSASSGTYPSQWGSGIIRVYGENY